MRWLINVLMLTAVGVLIILVIALGAVAGLGAIWVSLF